MKKLLLAAFAALVIGSVHATTAYVATNGDDGSAVLDDSNHPFKSIQSAVTALGAEGGTVLVAAGTYNESTATTCVTISAPVEVIGATGDPADVIVTRNGQTANIFTLDHADAKIQFLTVTDGLTTGAGAKVTTNGGTIEDCIFDGNNVNDWSYKGGLYLEAGRASRVIVRNSIGTTHPNCRGIGIYLKGAAVCEDSLIHNNSVNSSGAVYLEGSAVLRNCTVADNTGSVGFAGVWAYSTGCRVENCLIFGNWSWRYLNSSLAYHGTEVYYGKGQSFINCVADAEIPSSTGCSVISIDPFVDRANGDYRTTAALRERPSVGYSPVSSESFATDFRVNASLLLVEEELTFEAGVVSAAGAVTYAWDFGDGNTLPASSSSDVTHTYAAAGNYTVTLTADDGASVAQSSRSLKIGAREVNVAAGGDIQAAIDAAVPGTTIRLAAGTYTPSETISITKGVTIVGDEGAQNTVINGQKQRQVISMNDFDAVVCNVTITGGKADLGAGIRIGALGGTVEGCIITNNTFNSYGTRGVGIYMENGKVQRCVIARNSAHGHTQSYAPGVYVSRGQVLNSLIAENSNATAGGAIRASGDYVRVVNCTIVANSGTSYPAAYSDKDNAKFINCAIFDNTGNGTDASKVCNRAASCINCAAQYSMSGGTDWQIGSASFADAVNHNYRLGGSASCCFDAGCDPSEYVDIGDLDLDGNPRAVGTIDIGCFENQKDQIVFDFTVTADRYTLPAAVTLTPSLDGSDDPYTVNWYVSNTVNHVVTNLLGDDDPYVWNDAGTGVYDIWGVAHVNDKDVASIVHETALRLSAKDLYVLPVNDNAACPYDTQLNAATNIADAVRAAADGATVHVLPGETSLHYRYEEVVLDRAITVQGEAPNRGVMITNAVRSSIRRFFSLDNANAKVANLTFAGGYTFGVGGLGANFNFTAAGGMVSNCLVKSGHANDYGGVGGVAYMNGGLITHTEITGEYCSRSHHTDASSQSGILVIGNGSAKIQNCFIHDITFAGAGSPYYNVGALVHIGYADNLTIVNADIPDTNWGTLAALGGCGIYPMANNGTIRNCVVANVRSQHFDSLRPYATTKPVCFVNCAGDATAMNETCIQSTPAQMFQNPSAGDYSPKLKGPLYDTATAITAFDSITDILGNPRVFHGALDIGAIESQLTVGTTIIYR